MGAGVGVGGVGQEWVEPGRVGGAGEGVGGVGEGVRGVGW